MTVLQAPKDTKGWWQDFWRLMGRPPAAAKVLFLIGSSLGLGSLGTVAFYRFLVLDRLVAIDADHRGQIVQIVNTLAVEQANQDGLAHRVNLVETSVGTLIRAECLRTTKLEHDLLQMNCPENLFKGGPR